MSPEVIASIVAAVVASVALGAFVAWLKNLDDNRRRPS